MPTDDEVTCLLMSFGLNEKEARLYLQLLKYGPKTLSQLAKSLNTYRTDVHRTSNTLIEKGMVRPSLNSPATFTAVDLDAALASVLEKRESELRELRDLRARSRELQELSKEQRFRPSDEVTTFRFIKSVKELISVGMTSTTSSEEEVIVVAPSEIVTISSLFGVTDAVKSLVERGATFRLITDISNSAIPNIEEALSIGEEIRHYANYAGIFFAVLDRKICFQGINLNINRISLNQPLAVLWSDDPTYAKYLVATFDMIWRQAIPAADRLQELREEALRTHRIH